MAATNRAAKLAKLLKVAKKHYQPVMPPMDRTVIEHLMYACCLQDSTFTAADESFARLQQNYFDWNEVRVTTAVELAEVMSSLSEPSVSATRLKKTLHSMFETHYSFDIETLRKENLGKAIEILESYKGVSLFVVSYVAQNGFGGHSIGVDKSLINLMYTVGVIDQKEAKAGVVPGMERAIAKNKGNEFFSIVHQLAVAYTNSPFNNDIRAILLSIDAEAKDRFPKRVRKKKPAPEPQKPAPEPKQPAKAEAKPKAAATKATKKPAKATKAAAKKTPAKKAAPKKAASKKAAPKKAASKKAPPKKTTKKAASKKAPAKKAAPKKAAKKAPAKKAPAKKAPAKKAPAKKAPAKKAPAKKAANKKVTKKKATKSSARSLSKKKPR